MAKAAKTRNCAGAIFSGGYAFNQFIEPLYAVVLMWSSRRREFGTAVPPAHGYNCWRIIHKIMFR
jgi:hypothetical protein